MSVSLNDYEWELGGVVLGRAGGLRVESFDPGGWSMRVQDQEAPHGDYRVHGRDQLTPGTWAWQLYTDASDAAGALSLVDDLTAVWNGESTRTDPGAVMPCRYKIAGRTRLVYGRPRNLTSSLTTTAHTGKIQLTCDFDLTEQTYYDDDEQSVQAPLSGSDVYGGGFEFPLYFPLTSDPDLTPRVEVAVVAGSKPSWLTVSIDGPVNDPWISLGSFIFSLRGFVDLGETITFSGAPWDMGVRRQDGAYVPGMLDARTHLSQLRLPPGSYPFLFGGDDNTGTSQATVSWRDAWHGM